MPQEGLIELIQHEDVVLARVRREELDNQQSMSLQDDLLELAEQRNDVPVVLDMGIVTYIPSLAIGTLVGALTEFKKGNRRFLLVDIQPSVREVLAITSLDRIFEIYDDLDSALEQIRLAGQ